MAVLFNLLRSRQIAFKQLRRFPFLGVRFVPAAPQASAVLVAASIEAFVVVRSGAASRGF